VKICLLTRSFLGGGGIGRVSTEITNGLRKAGHEVYCISSSREDLVGYFKYTFFDIRRKIPKGYDIYHAVTPMESIWIPKDKGIVTILDIIAITHPERYGGRMGKSKVFSFIGKMLFKFGCRQALRCKSVVCISEHVKEELIKHFGMDRNKVKVIRLGINEGLFVRETL